MANQATKRISFFDQQVSTANVIVISGLVLLLGVGVGSASTPLRNFVDQKVASFVSQNDSKPTGDLSKQDFDLYWQVYNQLQTYYVDPEKLDTQKLYYGSIKGLVESIGDSPTAFFDPTETAEYKKSQSGTYSGIGAELDYVNKAVVVVAPFDGSPAAKAGIEARDYIIKVNDKSVSGKTLTQVVTEIRGEAGTKVKISIVRPRENNKEHTYEITRGSVSAPSMVLESVKNGVATVKISRFTESSLTEWTNKWSAIAKEIKQKESSGEVKSIVIDLRNNPGGYFDAAVLLAGDFLPKGTIIAYQREKSGADQSFPTTTNPLFPNTPVVILVNESSASASEIFAGAMQHYKRAVIVGEETYGKGTAQIIVNVGGGASLHMTISKWLLPSKEWINPENKIKPNKEVLMDYDLREKGVDNQMDEALKLLK
jgi:carboxyl-terminal processing protease